MNNLVMQHCHGENPLLLATEITALLTQLPAWSQSKNTKEIYRDYEFSNFDRTIAFVNALAWIANSENHHPDLEVGYKHCLVRYSTHSAGGLTRYDFICAAKIDALI